MSLVANTCTHIAKAKENFWSPAYQYASVKVNNGIHYRKTYKFSFLYKDLFFGI